MASSNEAQMNEFRSKTTFEINIFTCTDPVSVIACGDTEHGCGDCVDIMMVRSLQFNQIYISLPITIYATSVQGNYP